MRALLQRVGRAQVSIDRQVTGAIGPGLLILIGVTHTDTEEDVRYLASKCINLRIFQDDNGKMNRSLADVQGEALIVSQFTLYADSSAGRRPSYTQAAEPVLAERLYQQFIKEVQTLQIPVATGVFGADMTLDFTNLGPVTILVESKK